MCDTDGWDRRRLRLVVLMLFSNSDVVIPIFIFTPEQIENEKNSFKSSNAVQELVSTLASERLFR